SAEDAASPSAALVGRLLVPVLIPALIVAAGGVVGVVCIRLVVVPVSARILARRARARARPLRGVAGPPILRPRRAPPSRSHEGSSAVRSGSAGAPRRGPSARDGPGGWLRSHGGRSASGMGPPWAGTWASVSHSLLTGRRACDCAAAAPKPAPAWSQGGS